MTPGDRREPPADTKCPPAAQRKQAKRACNNNMVRVTMLYIFSTLHLYECVKQQQTRNILSLSFWKLNYLFEMSDGYKRKHESGAEKRKKREKREDNLQQLKIHC